MAVRTTRQDKSKLRFSMALLMLEGRLDGKRNRGVGATEKTDQLGPGLTKAGQQTHAGQSPAGRDIT
jgi:hypothetical protein